MRPSAETSPSLNWIAGGPPAGARQRAQQTQRSVLVHGVDDDARVEVAAICAVPTNDDVMGADVVAIGQPLAIALALTRPPPPRRQAGPDWIGEVDDDEDA